MPEAFVVPTRTGCHFCFPSKQETPAPVGAGRERDRTGLEFDMTHDTDDERFWSHVQPTGFCWEWKLLPDTWGYGRFRPAGARIVQAHRFAHESLVGPIPDGLELDHLCRNRICVNPDHLQPVTHRENDLRGYSITAMNARKTHCPHGHAYDGSNLLVEASGHRRCRTCRRAEGKRRYYSSSQK